jgi:ribonuclease HI
VKEVTIYTDGACSGNPGPGGWGVLLMYMNNKKELSGFDKSTTNNKMELLAAIKGLEALKEPCKVSLYSDSAYLCNAINEGWLDYWKTHNWRTKSKEDVKNVELWEKLVELMGIHDLTFIKVKGHADNEYNNRCDALATGEIAKNTK